MAKTRKSAQPAEKHVNKEDKETQERQENYTS